MYRDICRWLACVVAGTALAACSSGAQGQELAMPGQTQAVDPGYSQAPTAPTVGADASSGDLAKDVAELRKSLRALTDKAAADKEKAAGKPTVFLGGLFQLDGAAFDQDAESTAQFGEIQNAVGFRRVRLLAAGDAFQIMDYKIEMEFVGTGTAVTGITQTKNGAGVVTNVATTTQVFQQTSFKDVYLGVHDLPYIGAVRAGHFKEPFGLEELTSDKFVTFMERSVSDDGAIVPGRNLGAMAFNTYACQRGTWASGLFVSDRRAQSPVQLEPPLYRGDDGYAWTSRITFLPWYDEASGGRGLWHLGGAYSYRDDGNGTLSYSAKPESFLAPTVVNVASFFTAGTANADIDHTQLLGAETAFEYGSFSVQSELFKSFIARTAHADCEFTGAYVYVSYFLTGENRPYNRQLGYFDRVKPFTNFFRIRTCDGDVCTGRGAWEVAYRFSYLDLNSGAVTGGMVADHTLGVNWYLNPYSRLMLNAVNSHVDRAVGTGTDGTMNILEMRAQFDF
jgi:phosphate-selective porin OprO and OprP